MGKILEVNNLRKKYSNFALQDISFSLESGYIMGFIGPNGAGKTTTIKLIMNLLSKDGGEIKVFGLDSVKDEIPIKEKLGFVYDQNYYYEELTIAEMKRVVASFYREWDDNLYHRYLQIFKLDENKKIKELSRGMQMKFSLIMALSHNAELLIMDEPTSGLDPLVRRELLDILQEIIQDENKSVFFSTHITSDLDKIADFVTFINDGEIIMSKERDEIINNYGIVKGKKELLKRSEAAKFIGVRENEYGFEALTADKEKSRKELGKELVIDKPTLEDILVFQIREKGVK